MLTTGRQISCTGRGFKINIYCVLTIIGSSYLMMPAHPPKEVDVKEVYPPKQSY